MIRDSTGVLGWIVNTHTMGLYVPSIVTLETDYPRTSDTCLRRRRERRLPSRIHIKYAEKFTRVLFVWDILIGWDIVWNIMEKEQGRDWMLRIRVTKDLSIKVFFKANSKTKVPLWSTLWPEVDTCYRIVGRQLDFTLRRLWVSPGGLQVGPKTRSLFFTWTTFH